MSNKQSETPGSLWALADTIALTIDSDGDFDPFSMLWAYHRAADGLALKQRQEAMDDVLICLCGLSLATLHLMALSGDLDYPNAAICAMTNEERVEASRRAFERSLKYEH